MDFKFFYLINMRRAPAKPAKSLFFSIIELSPFESTRSTKEYARRTSKFKTC